ncbi:T-cell antigen CD7 isoform X2 [Xenopus laevis]|uniref:T-cell antigen CD7 isoform X2 n=1 Tax=Xenopus laevis TaxID=8355 RepID=A0A8J1M129_XENLA|nr:T-cell antigen CD7 isoform X2 [Xenopus laevis]
MLLLFLLHFSQVTANCFTENSDGGIMQTPKLAIVRSGGSVSISCLITTESEIYGVNVIRHFRRIMYINSENRTSREPDYKHRLLVSGSSRNFTVTLTNLTESDSDIYLCNAAVKNFQKEPCGNGTIIFVLSADQCPSTSKEQEQTRESLLLLPILLTVAALPCLLLLLLAIFKIYRIQLKTALQKLPQNSVYMDMTQTRRNTMSNSYSTALVA